MTRRAWQASRCSSRRARSTRWPRATIRGRRRAPPSEPPRAPAGLLSPGVIEVPRRRRRASFTNRVQPAHAVTSRTRRSLAATDESERITPLLGLTASPFPPPRPSARPVRLSNPRRPGTGLGARSRSTYQVSSGFATSTLQGFARVRDVSVRTLDKALWQHSRALRRSQAPVGRAPVSAISMGQPQLGWSATVSIRLNLCQMSS